MRNINVTTRGKSTRENRGESDQYDTRKLKVEKKTVTSNRGNNATTAPLTMKITTSPGRCKPLKRKGEMKTNAGFDIFDDRRSSRADITKAEVVPSMPDIKLAAVVHVDKDPRHS